MNKFGFCEYEHVQRAPMFWLLVIPGLIMIVAALLVPEPAVRFAPIPAGALMMLVSLSMVYLRIFDTGDALRVRFGPLPLFGTTIRYEDMLSTRAERSRFIDGWGIHYVPGRGWLYNLWGYDCIAIGRTGGKETLLGTDDVEGLTKFLAEKIPAPEKAEMA